jgi:hypothetical protein
MTAKGAGAASDGPFRRAGELAVLPHMTKKPPRRGRKPIPEKERKDSLVQTRVPGELSQTLREAAKKNRVTVSQLIRNVLEDAFALVDDVVAETKRVGETVRRDARRIAESAQGRRTRDSRAADAALERVDAWQEVLLNRDVACARCDAALRRGSRALVGLGGNAGAAKIWLCVSCSRQL